MKKLLLITLLLIGTYGENLAQEGNKLIVKVSKIASAEGTIRVAVFNSKENFLKTAIAKKVKDAGEGEMVFEFDGLKDGDYAVGVIHDINLNGILDKNFIGIPSEPYGISKDGKSNFGPPDYEDALFRLEKDITLSISL